VYRVYRELELNLRIKPTKRIVREKPEPLAIPEAINDTWSMDFMHDGLSDRRSFRLLSVILPCENGISHNEIENAAPEDFAAGCNVLLHAMLEIDSDAP
jgi:hypothetical protein